MTLAISRVESRSWVELMAPAVELAKAIAGTEFVPRALRDKPAAIAAAILYGDEIGLGPMVALQMVAVIDGRPYVAAQAQRALVLSAGHELWLEEATNARATWAGRRHGSQEVTRITWTMDDSRRAHLDRKPNWQSYPRAMLSARASAELVRATFADAVGGLRAIEELEDFAPDLVGLPAVPAADGTLTPAPAGRRARTPRRTPPVAVVESAPAPPPRPPLRPPEPVGTFGGVNVYEETAATEPAAMTGGQRNRMHGLFRARNIPDRADRLILTAEVIGRPVKSSKELTSAEADRIIDYLERMGEPDDGAPAPVGEEPAPEPTDTLPL
jgi:hypothetical protein